MEDTYGSYGEDTRLLYQRIKELENLISLYDEKEKQVLKRERYYRALVHAVHDDIMVVDRDYRITDVNKPFLATCGLKKEDIIGQYCYELSHHFDKPCNQEGEECPLSKVFETGQAQYVWHQHFHSAGWLTWVDIRLSPLVDEKGNITHVVKGIHDVSDLVKAGKLLEESEKRHRRIVSSPIG